MTIEDQMKTLTDIGFPESLAKACFDNFFYALKLRTGEVIEFSEATDSGEGWVHLKVHSGKNNPNGYIFDRGIDVRTCDIVWCADAPNGS